INEYLKRRTAKFGMSRNSGESDGAPPQITKGGIEVPAGGESTGKTLISVVTPSFRQVDFLKCCAASVADQSGRIEVEHLIHDGGSGQEFEDWARTQQHAICVSEKDDGMYDAINRGFRKAKGDIVAWLNCDEQYLPGTLDSVARYFTEHPEIDILFGDLLLVDEVMTPLAYRRAVMPTLGHIHHSHLSTFSAATFVRRRVLDDGHFLHTRWKTIADAVWVEELLAAGYRAATVHQPLASFCMLGSNLGQSPLLFEERAIWENEIGATNKWSKRWYILEYRIARLRAGAYMMRRVTASCFIRGNPKRTNQSRWVSGQWSVARDEAADLRTRREGALGGLGMYLRPTRVSFLHAVTIVVFCLIMDGVVEGDAVKGPSVMLFSLLYLSFRSKLKDLTAAACAYFLISWYVLSERPTDVIITRLATFTVGAILAVFWSASLRNLEEWMRSTIMLIRRMNDPVMLTDRHGRVILVNNKACQSLEGVESNFMGRTVVPLTLNEDGQINGRAEVFDADNRVPGGTVGLTLEGSNATLLTQ
ncbi:MAG: glycosyltransferase, partial [Verrucomicrobiaceae bacterium]